MSFVKGTKIFTDTGWKNVEDIAGHDKVLVRNFLGDAEFIQPFALKKREYDGEVVQLGGKMWSFTVTPDHIVVYDRPTATGTPNFHYKPAEDVELNDKNRIYRKFKYLPAEEYKQETVVVKDDFGKRWLNISNEDWYTLVGYVLCRGYLEKTSARRSAVNIFLRDDKLEEEIALLSDILDRIGLEWSFIPSNTTIRSAIRVSSKNSLSNRLTTRLGSSKRKDMYIPDKMIYTGSKELTKKLIDTIISCTSKKDDAVYQMTTNNEKLVKSLLVLGTIWGYGVSSVLVAKAGTNLGRGPLKKDSHRLTIRPLTESYSPTKKNSSKYSGFVYAIDLFDGQVYVKEDGMPVWVNPK